MTPVRIQRRRARDEREERERRESRLLSKAFEGEASLEDVATLLETAPGPSPILNLLIRYAIGDWINEGGGWQRHKVTGERRRDQGATPDYTGSVDAAMSLAPDGWCWGVGFSTAGYSAHAIEPVRKIETVASSATNATPAIALAIAFLRALATSR